jgi:hypothetical protein
VAVRFGLVADIHVFPFAVADLLTFRDFYAFNLLDGAGEKMLPMRNPIPINEIMTIVTPSQSLRLISSSDFFGDSSGIRRIISE